MRTLAIYIEDIRCINNFKKIKEFLESKNVTLVLNDENKILMQNRALYKEYSITTLKHALEESIIYDLLLTFNPVFASSRGRIRLTRIVSILLKNCYRVTVGKFFEAVKLNIYFLKLIKTPLTLGGPYLVESFARERIFKPIRLAKVQILLPRGLDIDYKFLEDPEVENKIDVYGAHCEFDKNIISTFTNKPIYKIGFYYSLKQHTERRKNIIKKDLRTNLKKVILYIPHNVSEMENFRIWIKNLFPLINNLTIFIKLHPEIKPNNEKKFYNLSVHLQSVGFKIINSNDFDLFEKLRSEADLILVDGGSSLFSALRSGKPFMVLKPLTHFDNRNLPDFILSAIPTLDFFNFDLNQVNKFIASPNSIINFSKDTSSLRTYLDLDKKNDLSLWKKVNDYISLKIDRSFL